MPVNSNVKNIFSKSILLKSGFTSVKLTESQVYAIFILICQDLGWNHSEIGLNGPTLSVPRNNYYEIPLEWFSSHQDIPSMLSLQECLAKGIDFDSDFGLYFLNVCSLHKRRLKFQKILQDQPKPTMDQVGPRGLLEYGICDNVLLNSWLLWRKWIYDIDNRSAQETGYLFEPILASSLGGEAVSAENSPVKRLTQKGNPKSEGRQIDCYIGAENVAYEFKIRVTIAASGKGRVGEELSFPQECRAAGITPVLIVLDPTHSTGLSNLTHQFNLYDGKVYIGEQAWSHLEAKAGKIMSRFIDNYIKPPLKTLNSFDTSPLDSIQLSWSGNTLIIKGGNKEYKINRREAKVR